MRRICVTVDSDQWKIAGEEVRLKIRLSKNVMTRVGLVLKCLGGNDMTVSNRLIHSCGNDATRAEKECGCTFEQSAFSAQTAILK
jgi:hypothetical protein